MSLCIILYYSVSCYIMLYNAVQCCIIMYHAVSWCPGVQEAQLPVSWSGRMATRDLLHGTTCQYQWSNLDLLHALTYHYHIASVLRNPETLFFGKVVHTWEQPGEHLIKSIQFWATSLPPPLERQPLASLYSRHNGTCTVVCFRFQYMNIFRAAVFLFCEHKEDNEM